MSTAASSGSPAEQTGPVPPRIRLRDWPLVAVRALAVLSWTAAMATTLLIAWLPAVFRRRPAARSRARARRWVKRVWGRGVMRVTGVRVVTEGQAPPAGVLVVSNHLGYLDIPVLDSVTPMVFVARADLRRWPFWGFMATVGGTIYVDRATKRDVLRVRREMREALDRGENVIVFPEATSTAGETMLPFKPALLSDAAAGRNPVHWLTLSYRTPPGGPTARDRVCWWGDSTFLPHVLGLFALRARGLCRPLRRRSGAGGRPQGPRGGAAPRDARALRTGRRVGGPRGARAMTSRSPGPESPPTARQPRSWRGGHRWLRSWKRVVLLLYLALLGASHVARWGRPEPGPGPEQLVQRVNGSPTPESGFVTIAYRQWWTDSTRNLSGNLSRPETSVVLLHGSPGSGAAFRTLGPELGSARHTIAPDLPGFGGSTTRVPDYSIRAHAAMTLQLLDSLGIGRAHLVGFSLGGGVALEIVRADTARAASLTLLSSIGVQEHELLGEYHLNHAIHGLQLFGIRALSELVPHFGYLDDAFLSRSYARNFYDTDQRPLRGVLGGYAGPMLIVHGADDPLVPRAAAEEHHRIVPQSELVMLEGNHFMTFLEAERIAPPIAAFLDRAEAGTATVRATADPARIAAAAAPFDPLAAPPVAGFALFVTLLLIVAATFVSEDLTCIGTGLLIARGSLPWTAGVGACLAGLVVGDLLLYAGGRAIGRPVTRVAPLRWLIRQEELERACRWFTARGGALLLGGRFVPGTRLPTYLAAGVVRMPVLPFALWILVAAVLWTPLLVGGAALFGGAVAERIGAFQDRSLPWLVATALASLIALRVLAPLLGARGRRRFLARWGRVRRWEFWPPWLFYLPVLAWGLWLALRYRSLTVFTAANPAFPDGGLVGESKSEILGMIGDRSRVARTAVLGEGAAGGGGVDGVGGFPVVVKPDVGERGTGVSIVRSEGELRARLAETGEKLIVQEYVPGEELGVFHYRLPGEERGRIFGITGKRQPVVTGDGRRSLADLVLDDPRLRCRHRVFARRLGVAMDRVPAAGETVILEERGNHCHGCEFTDAGHLETPALAAAIERLSRGIGGFYFGRYDIRGPSMEDIRAGRFKVIELNGVSSEATDIYDPGNTLRSAYATLFRQWELAFRIGAANQALGARPTPAPALLGRLLRHFRPSGARWDSRTRGTPHKRRAPHTPRATQTSGAPREPAPASPCAER